MSDSNTVTEPTVTETQEPATQAPEVELSEEQLDAQALEKLNLTPETGEPQKPTKTAEPEETDAARAFREKTLADKAKRKQPEKAGPSVKELLASQNYEAAAKELGLTPEQLFDWGFNISKNDEELSTDEPNPADEPMTKAEFEKWTRQQQNEANYRQEISVIESRLDNEKHPLVKHFQQIPQVHDVAYQLIQKYPNYTAEQYIDRALELMEESLAETIQAGYKQKFKEASVETKPKNEAPASTSELPPSKPQVKKTLSSNENSRAIDTEEVDFSTMSPEELDAWALRKAGLS